MQIEIYSATPQAIRFKVSLIDWLYLFISRRINLDLDHFTYILISSKYFAARLVALKKEPFYFIFVPSGCRLMINEEILLRQDRKAKQKGRLT